MSKEHIARHYNVDSERMIDKVMSLPEQLKEAWAIAGPFASGPPVRFASLIICGMGGSSIGGLMLRDLVRSDAGVSIHIERGYSLPSWAGPDTPVICVSYSGGTEEVLSSFREALSKNCPVRVITSGGELEKEARKAGVPLLMAPAGLPPRAAIGYLFAPLVRLASEWGIFLLTAQEFGSALKKTSRLLQKYSLEADLAGNTALELAKRLYGKNILIYSANGLLAGAGYRWKCQINENSKAMAFFNAFPELGHNEIMAWDCPEKLRKDIFLIMICDTDDNIRVAKRMSQTYDLLEPLAGGAVRIESSGSGGREGRLARLLSIVALADMTSVYLAVEYGRDPTPIGKIEEIKKRLRSEDE